MFGKIKIADGTHKAWLALMPLAIFCLAGCSEQVPTAPIRGHITLSGEPVGPGLVIFQPERLSTGSMRPITTLSFNISGEFTGRAPVGKHQVIIQSVEGELGQEVSDSVDAPPKIPRYYADPAVSQMTALITDGENDLRFDLTAEPLR
jgi:hypothetical protein